MKFLKKVSYNDANEITAVSFIRHCYRECGGL